ncbi:hypothetical protein TSUD_289010 [Trifolium subterraneum]|uniref:Uncharacterized protein n=1 Tax=Trifolium subterraneum TaxID=3900 RepID=A0A2Z6M4F4_TRISU|nr:hypothetical protein TSUD_289010 [Trifolium subterraneum]
MEAQLLPNELTEMLEGVILPEESGINEQCIYKVPQKIRQVNPQAYIPRLISIGPFHSPLGSNSDENHLQEFNLQNLAAINFTGPNLVSTDLPEHITNPKLPKHFTDLLRTFLLPSSFNFTPEGTGTIDHAMEQVYSVSQLSEAGLKFKLSNSKCLLDLKFDEGVLKMPRFLVHDSTERYMRNILAFEECHISDKHSAYISQYFTLLDILINTENDVSIFVDKKIIINWMSDANAVATMVNNLCKNASMPKYNAQYLFLFQKLNHFYENPINKYKAVFVHEYFNTPWKMASTLTAGFLVLFTLIQAVCSIWSLVKSYKDKIKGLE